MVSAHNLTYQIVMMDYWSGLAKKHYSECGKKQLWTLNNVQQSPKYVEGSGCLSDCSIIHTQKKNTLTHTHLTNLVIPAHEDASPHPPPTPHPPDQLRSPHQPLADTESEREKKMKQRWGESEIHPGAMSCKHHGFFIRGGEQSSVEGEVGSGGDFRDSFMGFVLQHWGRDRWESSFTGHWR